MEADPEARSSKSFERWLSQDVPCDPLPFHDLDQEAGRHLSGHITVQDYRYGKVYMVWDPVIRGDEYLGAAPKRGSSAVCLPGRILVHLLCSQRAILNVNINDFAWHLQAVQEYTGLANNILSAWAYEQDSLTVSGIDKEEGWKGCASWSPWQNVLVHRPAMEKYIKQMLTTRIPWPPAVGNKHLLAFEPALEYPKRFKIHPLWRVCSPLKARECFPAYSPFDCFSCCDLREGPRGKESCWTGPYTYEACCQKDFQDDHKRAHCIATGAC
eukprot:gnl/TRDRNA2_/TRDRNA2_72030_c0_seq1.p1 gnl/TRDRNA2_/TRDRNA2_72030_c0~~gnl/TRDRNA2_/TRDRNA2_72030_c0_seq1.p1  ORF type:complete len:316 (-),score=33.96 gnl/TRDRNA2_/TRDRNA2_72030_c0_seq1:272-1081(-)